MRGFRVDFKVPELGEALKQIGAYDGKARLRIENAVKTSTRAISRGARQRVPVLTGTLKKSIGARFDAKNCVGTIAAKSPPAHLVEFGHGGSGPAPEHPFMRPAFENEKPELIRAIKEAVKP